MSVKECCPFAYDLFNYQEAIYVWLKHKGTVTWRQIHNQCVNLVQKSGFYDSFGESPEYKIFMPLLKIGLVELYKEYDDYVFAVSPEICILKNSKSDYQYRRHYAAMENDETKPSVYRHNGMQLLNDIPCLSKTFGGNPNYYDVDSSSDTHGLIKYTHKSFSRNMKYSKNLYEESPCIFKYKKESYESDYFMLDERRRYKINRKNPDAMSLCRTYINIERIRNNSFIKKIFTYYPNEKKLVCHYLPDIPTLYLRALIIYNPQILNEDELYLSFCKGHYEQVFSDIEEDFVELLDKKLVERS